MSREQLATRLLASEALVENNRLKTGALRETDWEKIAGAATILNKVDIRIDDNPMLSVADMNAKCRRLDDLGLVVIDYLQLMTSAGGKGYARGEPPAGGVRHLPDAEDHGQGAERAGDLPEPAVPCQ